MNPTQTLPGAPDPTLAILADTSPSAKAGRDHPATVAFTLRDLLVVTYAVPADRLRPHVPESIALDRILSPEGEQLALVQTICAYHENARWSVLPDKAGGQSFHQITYRALTRRDGRRGAFALRTYVSTDEGRAAQRALSRDADFARFSLYIAGDPARASYDTYTIRAQGDLGQTQIDLRAIPAPETTPFPFTTVEEMTAFLVDRPENYFRASAPKTGIGLLPQVYGALPQPTFAETVAPPRLSLLTTLRLLSPEDIGQPFAVLLFPAVNVTSFAPRFARFPSAVRENK